MSIAPNPASHSHADDTPDWPRMAFIGAGRVAHGLVPALVALGVPVVALASRTEASARCLADAAGLAAELVCADAQSAIDRADVVWLTVRDDAIAPLAAELRWRAGQLVIHCSGATELTALQPAVDGGAVAAGFHPLQIFSDPQLAAQRLRGSSVAIEVAGSAHEPVDPRAEPEPSARTAAHALLLRIAVGLGLHALNLPPGGRAAYHAGASFAASYLLVLLDQATMLWRGLGLDEAQTLRALLPLAHLSLDAAAALGLAAASAGPVARGDSALLARQVAALGALAPPQADLFRDLALRQAELLARDGRLDANARARLVAVLRPESSS